MSSFLDHGSAHIFLLAIGAGLGIRVVMHFVDKSRIKDEVESSGGRIISIRWNPLRAGLVSRKERAALLRSQYRSVRRHRSATCKTSFFTGVYWADVPRGEERETEIYSAPSYEMRFRCECRVACLSELRHDDRIRLSIPEPGLFFSPVIIVDPNPVLSMTYVLSNLNFGVTYLSEL